MQQGQDVKLQITERIKQSTSILIAVANNPSVDALSGALGLALMLNKLNKHTTAVFSGEVPPAIQFLEPNKTFENNVDALRDFIISLDKEKADRLRYKVEDQVVRIFITPYKTSISEKDLQYSQGDFNVDLVIALGVERREELDQVIITHGRILHDATVITINANPQPSSLGSINWNDGSASSLCEMLVDLSEALQQPGILDAQTSTSLLTGIVAATDRFSNPRTTPKVMTMSAQLMAAGANQQLIATNLIKSEASNTKPPVAKQANGTTDLLEQEPSKKEPGELDIAHEKTKEPQKTEEDAEKELESALPKPASQQLDELQKELTEQAKKIEPQRKPEVAKAPGSEPVNMEEPAAPQEQPHYTSEHGSWKGKRLEPPTLGGTLNATAEEALEESRKAAEEDRNNMLFNHGEKPVVNQAKPIEPPAQEQQTQKPSESQPQEAVKLQQPQQAQESQPETLDEIEKSLKTMGAPGQNPISEQTQPGLQPAIEQAPALPQPEPEAVAAQSQPEPTPIIQPVTTESQPAAPSEDNLGQARQAVSEALASQPFNPAGQPMQSIGAQEVPSMPNIPVSEPLSSTALQNLPPIPAPVAPPAQGGMPPMPPMPSSATQLPPAPDLPGLNQPLQPIGGPAPAPAPSNDPGQFKIPGA